MYKWQTVRYIHIPRRLIRHSSGILKLLPTLLLPDDAHFYPTTVQE